MRRTLAWVVLLFMPLAQAAPDLLTLGADPLPATLAPMLDTARVEVRAVVSCAFVGEDVTFTVEAPSWVRAFVAPSTRTLESTACLGRSAVTLNATETVQTTMDAPAGMLGTLTLHARVASLAARASADVTQSLEAAPFDALVVEPIGPLKVVPSNVNATFVIHLRNGGNHAALVAVEAVAPANVTLILPAAVALGSIQKDGPAAPIDADVAIRVAPPRDTPPGWSAEIPVTLRVSDPSRPEVAATPIHLSLLLTTKAEPWEQRVDAPAVGLLVPALVGVALALRRRR